MSDEQPTLEEQAAEPTPETVAEMRQEAHEHADEKVAALEADAAAEPEQGEAPEDGGEPGKADEDEGDDEGADGDERLEDFTPHELALIGRVQELEAERAQETEAVVRRRLRDLALAELPVDTLADAFLHLRRPFAPAAVKWKLQSVYKDYGGGVVVGYIDARLVVERLNTVWPWWEDPKYENAGNNALRCYLSLFDPTTGLRVTRTDIGTASGTEALKGTSSDAFKRAAVKFGVGVSIYAMRAIRMKVGPGAAELRTFEKTIGQGQDRKRVNYPILDRATEERLAAGYGRWLQHTGIALFGPTLDHGDEVGASGIEAAPPADGPDVVAVEEAQQQGELSNAPKLEDERAVALVADINEAYAAMKKVAPAKLPPAAFRAQVDKALVTSHEELEKVLTNIREITAASAPKG